MAVIVRYDPVSRSGDGQFHQMVVAFIGKIWAPGKVDFHLLANREKSIQQFHPFPRAENAILEQCFTAQYIFVLTQQRLTDKRLCPTFQTRPEDEPIFVVC